MIISEKYKFIYFANARTATTSLEKALQELNELELVIPDLRAKLDMDPFLKTQNLTHIRPSIIKEMMGEQKWSSYFKFTFVRNPWDWCLSQFFRNCLKANMSINPLKHILHPSSYSNYFELLKRRRKAQNFNEFKEEDFFEIWNRMKKFRGIENAENYFQSQFVFDQQGTKIVDFVGRFESVEKDTEAALEHIGLKGIAIPKVNVSRNKKDYRSYYTRESRELVSKHYERDVELLGYDF
jgi:hypothetical protein